MHPLSFIIVLFIINDSYCYARFQARERQEQNVDNNYDYLIFAQSWPQSNCWGLNNLWENMNKECTECPVAETESGWTIHGLWPTKRDGSHVGYCSKTRYSQNLLNEDLRNEMEIKWHGYDLAHSNDMFWNHEYEKHGSCAVDIKSADTLSEYFATSLELFGLYDIGKMLKKSNVVPGDEYSANDIHFAIKQTLGVNASTLACVINLKTKDQYLSEIYLCFNRSFKLIDCSKNSGSGFDCNYDKTIIYPNKNMKTCYKSDSDIP